jgi:GT2 family glycosyltransferase/glycosyltransferase involved in cell wall biosynthesis
MNRHSPPADTLFYHLAGSRIEATEHGLVIHVPGSAGVAVDEALAAVWRAAGGHTLDEVVAQFDERASDLEAEVAALRLAGLLQPPLAPPLTVTTPRPVPEDPPLVSVVIVSRNGRHHLETCLPSLTAQSYPHLEIIVVDDASDDGTGDYLHHHFPEVRLVPQPGGPNFAAGCNLGIRAARGELIFLLNNDTELEPGCVAELVAAQHGRANVGGVAAMMRFYHNRPFINGLGSYVPPRGFGYDLAIGVLDLGQYAQVEQVPLLCFGAALLPRTALEKVGLLDEAYEFYYEDADWSSRARALGLQLIAAPQARLYHKFSASAGQLPSAFKVRLSRRNRLRFIMKNYPTMTIAKQLLRYYVDDMLWLLHFLARGKWPLAAAIVQARIQFLRQLPGIWQARDSRTPVAPAPPPPSQEVQARMAWIHPSLTRPLVRREYRPHLSHLGVGSLRRRLLIISPDAVNSSMGGVGIRYWELARQLAPVADVTLAVPQATDLTTDAFHICRYREGQAGDLQPLAMETDVILLSGFTVYHHPFLRQVRAHLVIDCYDPMVLENLERFADRPMAERKGLHQLGVTTFNELFTLGDFFICASEKQRDYWLGGLTSANRVNPSSYAADRSLRRLIDVVPIGLPDEAPRHTQPVLKGVWPGIGPEDKVILWGGGLWDWLDPLTVIEAMPLILRYIPEARLFFMGTRHPNPEVPPSRMAMRAIERASELDLKDRAIFFNDWTPYLERVNYLLEADVGVSLHEDHIETRFSVRTRLMDYLWARLPMVVSGGDVLGELVEDHGLGRLVAAGDVTAVAEAVVEMLQSPVAGARFEPVVTQFRWSQVARPLTCYVTRPWLNEGGGRASAAAPQPAATPIWRLPAKVVTSLRAQGLSGLKKDVIGYLRWIRQR